MPSSTLNGTVTCTRARRPPTLPSRKHAPPHTAPPEAEPATGTGPTGTGPPGTGPTGTGPPGTGPAVPGDGAGGVASSRGAGPPGPPGAAGAAGAAGSPIRPAARAACPIAANASARNWSMVRESPAARAVRAAASSETSNATASTAANTEYMPAIPSASICGCVTRRPARARLWRAPASTGSTAISAAAMSRRT